MKKTFAALALGALLSACVSTSTTMLAGGAALPATAPASVVLYRTAAQVPGNYRELALLDSTADATMTNPTQMYNSMKFEAAKIGANAVILDATTEPGAGAQVAAAIFGVSANRTGRAIAILAEDVPIVLAPPPAARRGN